jgi:transposase InsO family protein
MIASDKRRLRCSDAGVRHAGTHSHRQWSTIRRSRTVDLSKLSLGWMKLGIVHEHIQPRRPQQNARHERMHRKLKEDNAKPPAATLTAQLDIQL